MAIKTLSDVKVKVVYAKKPCPFGHKIGDEWIVGNTTPAGICNTAYAALYPHIRVLQKGGQAEYPWNSGVLRLGCPDIWKLLVFELSVISDTTREATSPPPGDGELGTL